MTATGAAARRLARRVALTLRTSWRAMAFGAAAGFAMQALLPLADAWLAAAAAAGFGLLALVLLAADASPVAEGLPPRATIERAGTPAQFGHAIGTAALALGALAAGAGLAGLAGL